MTAISGNIYMNAISCYDVVSFPFDKYFDIYGRNIYEGSSRDDIINGNMSNYLEIIGNVVINYNISN
jgi:hypothetical protein